MRRGGVVAATIILHVAFAGLNPEMLLTGLLAFAVTLALSPVALQILRRRDVWDLPSARSSHGRATLRGGGVAPVSGALIAAALSTPLIGSAGLGPVAAAGFGLAGLLEDVRGVPILRRLTLQTVLAGVLAALVLPASEFNALWIGTLLLAVVWIVSYVNAFNFMDGINGISVAQAVVAGVTWSALGTAEDLPGVAAGGAIITGVAMGFAPFNVPRARMFLGDVGSYFFGAWLAMIALLGVRYGVAPEAMLAPLGLYLADTGATLVRRFRRGDSWYLPHREHVYQRLTARGWSHLRVTALVTLVLIVCSCLGAVALADSLLLRLSADLVLIVVLLVYLATPGLLSRIRPTGVAVAS